ncbi:MAG: DNA-methyltransferase [Candidatus Hodarchaeota archaeon]
MPSEKKKRKKPYVPHEAAAKFKPSEDWTHEEAFRLYNEAKFSLETDKVIYEDCIQGMRRLPAECVDVVVADPPFGISFDGMSAAYNRDAGLVVEGYNEVEGDYSDFTDQWIAEIPRLLKGEGVVWIFSGWTNLADVLEAVERHDLTLINHIIWKYQFGVFTRRKFVTSHYHILLLAKHPKKYYFNKIEHYPLDVWEINRKYMARRAKNSTKLPEEVVMRCIDFTSRPGGLIFDPFMGNGTTAVAAKGSYRHFLGFEINKQMRKIIDENIAMLEVGDLYVPYAQRPDDLVERAREKFGMEK